MPGLISLISGPSALRDAAALAVIGWAVHGTLVEQLRAQDGSPDENIFCVQLHSHFARVMARPLPVAILSVGIFHSGPPIACGGCTAQDTDICARRKTGRLFDIARLL